MSEFVLGVLIGGCIMLLGFLVGTLINRHQQPQQTYDPIPPRLRIITDLLKKLDDRSSPDDRVVAGGCADERGVSFSFRREKN